MTYARTSLGRTLIGPVAALVHSAQDHGDETEKARTGFGAGPVTAGVV